MKLFSSLCKTGLCLVFSCAFFSGNATGQDWPQWRGANRDAKALGFTVPKEWPKELTQKWKIAIGKGDASPAIVGERIYTFSRQDNDEVILCLEAATGKEVWREKYEEQAATEPMGRHPGPRSSPAVFSGKVLAFGVRGTLSCVDAENGKVLWRKTDKKAWPRFFTSSSPMAAEGLCIVQIGSEDKGGVFAYDIASGTEKWQWAEEGTAYSSPVIATVEGTKQVVAMTSKRIVGLGLENGKLLWEAAFPIQGRAYNAATPIVDGQTVIVAGSGRGTKALKLEKSGDAFTAKDLWSNPDNAVQFNTPVLKDGKLYGISQKGEMFCLSASDGKTLWTAPFGGKDFGSIVDAGLVLMALSTPGELVIFEPAEKELKKVATYKVGNNDIYAYPVPSSKGILIKDQDSVALWTLNNPNK